MQRLLSLLCLVFALSIAGPLSPATAQTEGVGIGASLGVTNGGSPVDRNPIGLNLKAWLSDRQAVSGMTSFFISGTEQRSPSYWILQGDYLFHNFNKLDVGEGFLALYIGAGAQYTVVEDSDNQFALRSPLGVNYLLGSSPIDVFVEVAPTLRVTDPSALRFDGAIGFRYYFDAGGGAPNAESSN
jgi:hypothetical protein